MQPRDICSISSETPSTPPRLTWHGWRSQPRRCRCSASDDEWCRGCSLRCFTRWNAGLSDRARCFALRRRLFWAEPGGKRTSISEKLRNYLWPAIAPDGKRLAVTIFEQGNWDLWVHDLERDSQTRLTSHDGPDFGPVWSPDGRWVAFCSQRDGRDQIYRQMADGSGQAERLLESQYDQGPPPFLRMGSICSF